MSLGSNTNLTQGENMQSPLPVACTREFWEANFLILPWIQVQANELHLYALIWHLRHLWHTDSIGSFVRCQPHPSSESGFIWNRNPIITNASVWVHSQNGTKPPRPPSPEGPGSEFPPRPSASLPCHLVGRAHAQCKHSALAQHA